MIKFFRKIRQKTLTENKFGKYLTYAIGEIILVVIGILIALQINNANDNSKLKQQTKTYEKILITELETDLIQLNFSDSLTLSRIY
jgi:sensor domain CHASE-containing protein